MKTYDPSTHVVLLAERRTLVHHLVRVAAYLGIGALVHAWFIGPEFDTGSLWSWGYVAMWPIPLAFWFVVQAVVFGLYAALVIVACALLWASVVLTHDALDRRRRARRRP